MNIVSGSNENLIQLIENTFNGVNNKINNLLDCSVKDFVLLNSSFQKYHNLIDNYYSATNNFFDYILSSNQDYDILKQCSTSLDYAQNLTKEVSSQIRGNKEIANKYSFVLLSITNLKQDLSTLRLLFTNLRFDPVIEVDEDIINSCFNNLHACFNDCENNVKGIYDNLKEIINFSAEGFHNGIELYTDLVKKIFFQVEKISNLREESKKYSNKIKEIERQKAASASEIITNLQFQDILRQKIEHIQEAHQHITSNLFKSHKRNNIINQDDLLKIRDITSLQSAQLIHANKEYQTAVENILKRISVLKQVVNSYQFIWGQFFTPEQAKTKNTLSKINEDLSLLQTQSFSLNQIADKYSQLLSDINSKQKSISSLFDSDSCGCTGILDLEKIVENTNHTEEKNRQYNPIHQLKDELKKFQEGYSNLALLLKELKDDAFEKYAANFQKDELSIENMHKSSEKITTLMKEFGKVIEKNSTSMDFSETISEIGVNQVEYYKTFEKEVKEIISLLDILLNQLNLSKSDISSEKLDQLRDMYTMQSERDVHDKLTHKTKKDNKDNNNKDEVEFF